MRLVALLLCAASVRAQGLDPKLLLQAATGTWPSYNGDYSGRRFSSLSQINQDNIGSLTLAWAFQAHQRALKSTPLEVDGTLYFTIPNDVWAVDARTARRRMLRTSRSQKAFAWGARKGVFKMLKPMVFRAESSPEEYVLSRSWIRNRYGFSPVMTSRNCGMPRLQNAEQFQELGIRQVRPPSGYQ
jgi:hypothetical protein